MIVRLVIAASVVVLSSTACAPREDAANLDATWVGTITSEGDVTTVVNESGSVWGGTATLVEEASIGVEAGADEYMFGTIAGVYATADEIFVLDAQKPAVRVYDFDGRHLRDLGSEGQGPGEFVQPRWVTGTSDGRIFVAARDNGRINVYGPNPGALDTWQLGMTRCCLRPMVATDDGVVWVETRVFNERRRDYDRGILAHGPDGSFGEPLMVPNLDVPRWTITIDGEELDNVVPYAPEVVWGISPLGAIIAGASDRYRFEVAYPDGSMTVMEHYWDPVAPSPVEIEYHNRSMHLRYGTDVSGEPTGFRWDGRMPEHKPAFRRLFPAYSGEFWVEREGEAVVIDGCDPSRTRAGYLPIQGRRPVRCFNTEYVLDAFALDGKYLGRVELADDRVFRSTATTFIRGDVVVVATEDASGTFVVKRYRLVPPEDEWRTPDESQ